MISKRDNLLRTIKRANPEWVPYRYDGSLIALRPKAICVKREEGGKDDWGVIWLQTKGAEGCYTNGKPVISIDQVDTYKPPYTNWQEVAEDLKKQFNDLPDKDCVIFSYCDFTIFERAQFILGTENLLIEILLSKKKVEKLFDIITDYQAKLVDVMMSTGLDGIRFCDDWGMQTKMFLHPELWRETVKPRIKILYDLVKKHEGIVWQHSCGHIEEIVPDLIEMGVDILDPCQPAANDVIFWKKLYGNKLSFLGGLDTQGYLSFSSPYEVRLKVKEFVRHMSVGGGYIAAPSHTISIPKENELAMIEAINEVNNSICFKKI
jgi:uroporphyrinogen decarboxylase